ncbi:hypothetical protein TCAL_15989, partial [Tigriopus californicus]
GTEILDNILVQKLSRPKVAETRKLRRESRFEDMATTNTAKASHRAYRGHLTRAITSVRSFFDGLEETPSSNLHDRALLLISRADEAKSKAEASLLDLCDSLTPQEYELLEEELSAASATLDELSQNMQQEGASGFRLPQQENVSGTSYYPIQFSPSFTQAI